MAWKRFEHVSLLVAWKSLMDLLVQFFLSIFLSISSYVVSKVIQMYGTGFTKSTSPELAASVKFCEQCCRAVDHTRKWPKFIFAIQVLPSVPGLS